MAEWSSEVYTPEQQALVDEWIGETSAWPAEELFTVVRTIIALHAPLNPGEGKTWYSGDIAPYCTGCGSVWPCSTLQVITRLAALV